MVEVKESNKMQKVMYFTQPVMIKNSINLAKYQLNLHQELGSNSTLSIFEVAKLMDVLRVGESVKENNSQPIFFHFSIN
jgi:hypothetical protein